MADPVPTTFAEFQAALETILETTLARLRAVLVDQPRDVRGAALNELMAEWLVEHDHEQRQGLLDMHVRAVRALMTELMKPAAPD